MSSNKLAANAHHDTNGGSVLTFSNNENQLLEILNIPPEIACEIAVPLKIRNGIYSIPEISMVGRECDYCPSRNRLVIG